MICAIPEALVVQTNCWMNPIHNRATGKICAAVVSAGQIVKAKPSNDQVLAWWLRMMLFFPLEFAVKEYP